MGGVDGRDEGDVVDLNGQETRDGRNLGSTQVSSPANKIREPMKSIFNFLLTHWTTGAILDVHE